MRLSDIVDVLFDGPRYLIMRDDDDRYGEGDPFTERDTVPSFNSRFFGNMCMLSLGAAFIYHGVIGTFPQDKVLNGILACYVIDRVKNRLFDGLCVYLDNYARFKKALMFNVDENTENYLDSDHA